jgi:uncharacterized RDD family membrane protein YckC
VKIARVFPVFSASYAVLYLVSMYYNLALITYHPALKQVEWLVARPKSGPAMYWYGWLLTAALGSVGISALALMVPDRWLTRVSSGLAWAVPLAVLLFFFYLLRGWFVPGAASL